MIFGVGTDMIEIERITKAWGKGKFQLRTYTESEQVLIGENMARAAGNFAVKEAVSKVFGTGFRGFGLLDIEVLRDEMGKPYVRLYGEAARLQQMLGIRNLYVSISNTDTHAIAFAIGESG